MKFEIVFTDTLNSDLRDIATYLAEQSKSKELAKKFAQELREQCMRLADFPKIGAIPKDRVLANSEYRFLVHKEYLIFYSVDDLNAKIYVHSVFNAKKDYTRVLKKIT